MTIVYIRFPERYGFFRATNYSAITANTNGAPE